MGTVHGVYLKYVGLSALSYAGYTLLAREEDGTRISASEVGSRLLVATAAANATTTSTSSGAVLVPALVLGYSALLNGLIAILFKLEVGMGLIGKDRDTGQIPLWSKILFFPFHLPTRLYTHVHTRSHLPAVPVASQVQPGWWVGGCYGHEISNVAWAGVIDLTVEFPETCVARNYLSVPTWDGVPASPAQLEEGSNFALAAKESDGHILVHCAHGRGRSTTMMCACLVKAGLYPTWQEAFEKGIKPGRSVCKLNRRMKQALTEWQETYVDRKKGQ